ncbi:hypothetical protein CPC08DRAFT_767038 [Agrocybe pediades]|nr:hypothetical protein CPC08DRAFT_767038 [Agrocybe pediades]
MSSSPIEFTRNPSLPSNEDVVALCTNLKFPRGTTIVDPSTRSVIAWVKCGADVALGETYTQQWTATALREASVSDLRVPSVFRAFTRVQTGDSNDVDLVARAVKALTSLKPPPTAALGRFGSDTSSIVHSFFFLDWLPNAGYRSDQDFYDHIRNILKYPENFRKTTTPDGQSVSYELSSLSSCSSHHRRLPIVVLVDTVQLVTAVPATMDLRGAHTNAPCRRSLVIVMQVPAATLVIAACPSAIRLSTLYGTYSVLGCRHSSLRYTCFKLHRATGHVTCSMDGISLHYKSCHSIPQSNCSIKAYYII